MTIRFRISSDVARGLLGAAAGVWISVFGCSAENPPNASSFGTSGGSSSNNTTAVGGASSSNGGATAKTSSVACIPEAKGETTHSAGNYDNLSCNKADCHVGYVGGWVYASTNGYPWVAGATVTIKNTDGTTLTAVSGEDGFFDFGDAPKITPAYKVCVSKCPSTDCNTTPHTSTDCLSADCHALPDVRIFVTTPKSSGTGGTSSTTGEDCTPPAKGGPYAHLASVYYENACVSCHYDPKPVYKGGFVFDGPTSSKTVAEATITLTPENGDPVTTVTGPDGMFFLGEAGIESTTIEIPEPPFTPCVSKCPIGTICSADPHTTTDDCDKCHDTYTTDKIYLR